MQATVECAELFGAQLSPVEPHTEVDASEAMMMAGRETRWRRNQACDAIIARGAVACVLAGAVRQVSVRAHGQSQLDGIEVAGD